MYKQSPQLSAGDLSRYAAEVGIDATKFDACLKASAHKNTIQQDIEEGRRLGITGTPAFFINGRPVSGAQPLETFARVIDEELTLAPASRQAKESSPVAR